MFYVQFLDDAGRDQAAADVFNEIAPPNWRALSRASTEAVQPSMVVTFGGRVDLPAHVTHEDWPHEPPQQLRDRVMRLIAERLW